MHIYTYNGILFSLQKNEILPFTIWIKLKGIMVSEIKQTEQNKYTVGYHLYVIDRVPDELQMEVHDIVQETGIQTIPMEKKCKKAKWLSEEALQIVLKEEKQKAKEKRKDISIWMQSSKE